MQTIKILGTGCPNCKRAEAIISSVVEELQSDVTIEKLEDIQDIMAYDIMSTPAIVLDEKVVIKGRVPTKEEIYALLEKTSCCDDADSSCCDPTDKTSDACCEEMETIPSPCCSDTEDKQTGSCC